MQPLLLKGQLVAWQDDRGFGFIKPEDGSEDVFLHISALSADRSPQIGDVIFYKRTAGKDGKARASIARIETTQLPAVNVSLPLDRRQPSSARVARSTPQPAAQTSTLIEALILSALPLLGAIRFALTNANLTPLLLYVGMSAVTFGLYAADKSFAEQGKRRISERSLHLCELLGGWIGAYVAQRTIRHKISKRSYQLVFRSIVALHIAVWIDSLFLGGTLIKSLTSRLS